MSSTTSELAPRLPRRAKLASSTGSASVTTASSSRNVLPGSHCGGLRLFRHDDPSYQVSNNPRRNSAQNRDHSPQQPHERHIHVDIIRQTRTHPSNLSIRPRTLQLSARNRCHPNPPPAVSAKISVIRNRLRCLGYAVADWCSVRMDTVSIWLPAPPETPIDRRSVRKA